MYKMINKKEIVSYLLAKLAEAPLLAKEKTQENGKKYKYRRAYFRVKKYIDEFLADKDNNRIVMLPGLRGVGKTTLLLQIYNYLISTKKLRQERVLYFSADELREYLGIKISELIRIYVEDILKTSLVNLNKRIFILIDEAHFDEEWSLASKIIYDQTKKVFLLLTGSSALSMEVSVDLARRAQKEMMFPMNFSEYLILKYKLFPPSGTAGSIRELIFMPSDRLLKEAGALWNKIQRNYLGIKKPLNKEFEYFMLSGGFPFSMNSNEKETYEKIFSMLDRVIERDIFVIKSFKTDTRNVITRILSFLVLQKPGGTSDAKLSERLKVSPSLIRGILETLEKTHLIFSVKPYGGAGKIVRKPWKYYFLSSSLISAMRYKLGLYNLVDRNMLGIVGENLVASYFFRMQKTINMPAGIFYDPEKEGVDFLLQTGTGEIIPVEVKTGKKDSSQIRKAIVRYNSKYGIVISNDNNVKMQNNVIYIPLALFSFV